MNILKKKKQTQVFDINLEHMQGAFDQMQSQLKWDITEQLVWGYFFLDQDKRKLEKFSDVLKNRGLSIIEIRKVDEADLFLLHEEEKVILTPEGLYNRCQELAYLARENEIEIFDGWDVGKV